MRRISVAGRRRFLKAVAAAGSGLAVAPDLAGKATTIGKPAPESKSAE